MVAAERVVDGSDASFFDTCPNTFAAEDTFVAVEGDVGMAVVDREITLLFAQLSRLEARLEKGGDAVQLAFAVLGAVLAVDCVRCHDQLEGHAL